LGVCISVIYLFGFLTGFSWGTDGRTDGDLRFQNHFF
jgi:hypothetical protein